MAETKQSGSQTMENAVKLVGDLLVPGASLLMDGKLAAGGAHLVAGAVARVALGPLGLLLVAANSYSTTMTGKGLLKQFAKTETKSS